MTSETVEEMKAKIDEITAASSGVEDEEKAVVELEKALKQIRETKYGIKQTLNIYGTVN